MAFRSRERPTAGGGLPAVREYGSLFLLLLASVLLGRFVAVGAGPVSDLRFVGSVVNTALALAVLAAGYAAYRQWSAVDSGLDRHDLLQIGGATGLVLFVVAYRLHGDADPQLGGGQVVTALLTGAVAMALPAFVYAGLRGLDVRVRLPDRDALPLAGVAVLASALAGAGWLAAILALGEWTLAGPVLGGFGPSLSAGDLVGTVAVPGALVGLGMAVLYNGAAQEALRERLGPVEALAAATALVAGSFVGVPFGPRTGLVATVGTTAVVVLASLLAALVAARAVRVAPRLLDVEPSPVLAAVLGALVVLVPVLCASVILPVTATLVPAGASIAVVAAVGSVGYERSRSVWIPALAFATYLVVADASVAAHLAAMLG